MRIRKETSPWNGKMFIRLALIFFFIFNSLLLLVNFLDGRSLLAFSYSWGFSGLIQPLLLASIFTSASRRITLYVNDYQNIESFEDKLNKTILGKKMSTSQSNEAYSSYASTGWFYKLFNNWDREETVSVGWGNEVVIKGSARIVSQVEDALTWNSVFK